MKAPPQKSCGACKACCVDLIIKTPEFHKPAHQLCPHHTGTGCGIYKSRYPVCRDFLCGWRLLPELNQAWRPDRSGVLIVQVAQDSLAETYRPAGHGVLFVLTGGEAALARPGFALYVLELVRRGVAVHLAAGIAINPHLLAAAAAQDRDGAVAVMRHLYRLLLSTRDRKGFWRGLPHLYRLRLEKGRIRNRAKAR